jgi:glycosyltransferase involved in cell wall biosynthesis
MKQKYRILYVEKPLPVGGSVIGLYQLVRGLDATRYEPVVLFYGLNPYRERFREIGVPVLTLSEESAPDVQPSTGRRDIAATLKHVVPGALGSGLAEAYWQAKEAYTAIGRDRPLARRVARLLREQEIDLVHHNNSLPCNRETIMAARMAGVRQVSHVRGLNKFSTVDRCIGRSVDAFVFMSTAIQQQYHELGIPPEKGHVIYDAFDARSFASAPTKEGDPWEGSIPMPPADNGDPARSHAALRAELGLREDDRVISNVGRLDWWKGQDYFLQAIAEIAPSYPKVKALLIGAPDHSAASQAFEEKLRRMVEELDLSEHILFTGFRSDVTDLLGISEMVIHSASEPEPFGRVVATAAGGVLDIVQDQATGLLVPPKDATAMACAIRQLLQNREQATRMGQEARKNAQERFSIKQHMAAIQNVYEGILSTRTTTRRKE